ncbi:trans-AT type I polyketide synthase/nonribosomal peptide synthetase [Candidatus Scalindua japonica]|uniref:Trans-AT type I polyketide synthase/nonribosomal peptide synthetase n=1 Tax=Candidatus Scalindua japonica TaxID=1284222 RepID=A0A286TTE9_9BACT|nr:SDR family NAD(P)-dependent oxidoreductase [Candidatus Scalindua japonica]GAX59143.1 trans-AT type I polyketide synthase/nonribosomal peptide synthetase [Candidatus Scalindua japonica]
MIEEAISNSGVSPDSISYLEAHGTGTLLGDPIEIKAATQVYRKYTQGRQVCGVGSVKSNIGHLLRAAGVASFIKVVLALKHRQIPPTLHCEDPHPRFRFDESPFYPVTELEEWRQREGVRRSGISSFGFGGTNCHMIVEEFDNEKRGYKPERNPLPLTQFHKKRYWIGNEQMGQRKNSEILMLDDSASMREYIKNKVAPEKRTKNLADKIEYYIVKTLSGKLNVSLQDVDVDENYLDMGLDSTNLIIMSKEIEDELNIELYPTTFFEHPNISELSVYFAEEYRSEFEDYLGIETEDYEVVEEKIYDKQRGKVEELLTEKKVAGEKIVRPDIHFKNRECDIAVIGMSCVFPGSSDCEEYWRNLESGNDLITEVPYERWDWKEFYGDPLEEANKTNSKWGGFIEDIDKFDASFFKISPREAELMDPQHRIYLEMVWRAIEDAGYRASALSGTKTGIFAGVSSFDYSELSGNGGEEIDAYTSTGIVHSMLPNRISYLLNIHGPSEPVDTACSSSLVAIHRAVRSIQSSDCDMAIAGGINIILSPKVYLSFSKAGMLSPEGKCKTFDKSADGYVRGEGGGALLLKPLKSAIDDGDHIYGVIKGSAVNHGGHASSLTAPNPDIQAALLVNAYENAGIDPETVSYIETHGTGTPLGDPLEINGLKKAFKEINKRHNRDMGNKNYCGIGSVKTNIGHLEAAAGIAGVIKILLAMKHRKIPATVNFKQLNPYIDIADSPFYVAGKTHEWKRLSNDSVNPVPRRAGVSSFGFGGSNAHIVLEEYDDRREQVSLRKNQNSDESVIIVLSAKRENQLSEYVRSLSNFIKGNYQNDIQNPGADSKHPLVEGENQSTLADIAYTLQTGRDAFNERLAIVVKNNKELEKKLDDYLNGVEHIEDLYRGSFRPGKSRKGILEGSKEERTFVLQLFNAQRYSKIAEFWVEGSQIDWEELCGNKGYRRMSLPTYPFARERHWITSARNSSLTSKGWEKQKELYYHPVWINSDLTYARKKENIGNVLVFDYGEKLLTELGTKIDDLGNDNELIHVASGSEYRKLSKLSYEIDPELPGDYERLMEDLEVHGLMPSGIIHLWNYVRENKDLLINKENLDDSLKKGVYSLFHISKALIKRDITDQVRLLYIFPGSQERVDPQDAAIGGFARSLRLENPKCDYKTIQIDPAEVETTILDIAIRELRSLENNEQVDILYRNNNRYVRSIVALEQKAGEMACFSSESDRLKKNGIYLITGGAGGLGLIFARYLATRYMARLVLTGRSALSKETEQKIKEIDESGGKIAYIQADVCKLEDMENVVREAKKRYKRIDGVIHSAGMLENAFIQKKDKSSFEKVISPKIYGLINVDRATKDERLDFFVMFSSLTSVTGNIGQCDYATGNRFMDSYADLRDKLRSDGKRSGISLSINWPFWQDGGMKMHEEYVQQLFRISGLKPLSRESGIKAFEDALISGERQFMVINGEKDTVNTLMQIPERGRAAEDKKPEEFDGDSQTGFSSSKLEDCFQQQIIKVFSELLKVEESKIDVDTDISEYGVDSIMIMKVVKEIETRFGLKFYPNELQQYNTIHKITAYLEQELKQVLPESTKLWNINKPDTAKPLIFVLSTPRAGSTLLRVMLMGHTELFAPPELNLLPFDTLNERNIVLTERNQKHLKEGLIVAIKQLQGLSTDDAIEKMKELEGENKSIHEIYQYLRTLAGDRFFVDKSPFYAMDKKVLNRSLEICKNSFYIYLIRHPLSVMESFVRNRFNKLLGVKDDPWLYSEKLWREMNTNIRTFLSNVPRSRWIGIHFEDLVRNPEYVMKAVCTLLHIDYEESMILPYSGNRAIEGLHGDSLQVGDPNFLKHDKIKPGLADVGKGLLEIPAGLSAQTIKVAQELGYSIASSQTIGLLPAQKAFMNRFGTDPVCHIVQIVSIQFKEGLDRTRLEISFQKVIQKHAVLRYSFSIITGEWIQSETENDHFTICYDDLSGMDEKMKQSRMLTLESELNRKININRAPLLTCAVVDLGSFQYQIMLVIHHLIADGETLKLIYKELLGFYENPEKGVEEIDQRYRNYYGDLLELEKNIDKDVDSHKKYWMEQMHNQQVSCPLDFNKGPNIISSEKEFTSMHTFRKLGIDKLKPKNMSFYYLSVGLYYYMADWIGKKEPVIIHRLHRRNVNSKTIYYDVAGWFAGDIPLSLSVESESSVHENIQRFRRKFLEIPMGGVTYEILSNRGLLPYAYKVGSVRLNYQPEFHDPNIEKIGTHIYEPLEHERLYMIDLIVRTEKDHFVVIVRYSSNYHNLATIKHLVRNWINMTRHIISESSSSIIKKVS